MLLLNNMLFLFVFINVVGHDNTKTPSSFHPRSSMDYAELRIWAATGAYSIHLYIWGSIDIDLVGTYSSHWHIWASTGSYATSLYYSGTYSTHW